MAELPFNKLITDNRFADAGDSTSFEVSLPETLSLPQNAVAYICDVQITNTMSTMDNFSNTFYFIERTSTGQDSLNPVVLDTAKVYSAETLKDELQTKLNAVSLVGGGYTVEFVFDNHVLKFNNSNSFFIVNDDLLRTPAFQSYLVPRTLNPTTGAIEQYTLNYNAPQSMMQLLGLGRRGSQNTQWSELLTLLQGTHLFL